jgi:putative phosphotransacetylase
MEKQKNKKVLVEVSSRHLHLSKEDFEILFGKNKILRKIKDLSQPGEFSSDKFVTIHNKGKGIKNVRVVGPFRENSQLEISLTDAYYLNLKPLPKLKLSGDLKGTTKIKVIGKKESKKIPCIIAKRHFHISEEQAKKLNLKNNEKINIKIKGERELIFKEVIVRVSKNYKSAVHLDTDEGNSAGIFGKTFGELILEKS